MTNENKEKLSELNFKELRISWVGKIKKYCIEVLDKQDAENELVISFVFAPNENKGTIFTFLDDMQKSQTIRNYDFDKDKILIVFIENENNNLKNFLVQLADVLASIELKCKCQNCESTEDLDFYKLNGNPVVLCPDCSRKIISDIESNKNKADNYLKGFFGSLLGALIGSVVWILIGAFGFFAGIAGYAIAYGAFKGYAMAKGKLTRTGIVINIITMLIAFIFAQYIGLFIELMKEWEGLNFLAYLLITPALFSDKEILISLLPDIGLGLLFIVLGAYRTVIESYKRANALEGVSIEKIELEF